ncbi:MAG: glycosyltransferase [candidate division WOR-3 bacterium]
MVARRVLVVSYYTPPLGLSGVMRVTKLVKFLPDFGWRPLILTVKPAAYYYYDPALLSDLRGSKVFRTESFDPARLLNRLRPVRSRLNPMLSRSLGRGPRLLNYLLFPDSKAGWFPFASVAGRHIIDRERPAAIFATGPPFTALLVGVRLKAHGHLPLVADFRDPWPTGFVLPPQPQRTLLRRVRGYIVRHADAILAVNYGTARELGPKAEVLDNGFDPDEFDVEPARLDGFSIVHVGNLWQNQQELLAVCQAIRDVPDAQLYLAGRVDRETRRRLGQEKQVRLLGTVAHDQACRLMKGANVLLYIGKPGQPVGIKLYEYLGARRPILVFGPDTTEAAAIVEQCEAGVACAGQESLGQALMKLRSEATRFTSANRDRYDRRVQAGKLAALMERLVTSGT